MKDRTEIELLALERTFAELTAAEQSQVLIDWSPAEFDALRKVLLAAPHLDAGQAAPPGLRADLLVRFQEKNGLSDGHRFRIRQLAYRRVPVWKAAVACFLFAIAGGVPAFFLQDKEPQVMEKTVVQTIEKTILKTDTIWLTRYRFRDRPIPIALNKAPFGLDSIGKVAMPEEKPTGQPIGQQPDLQVFFTAPAGTDR